MSAADAAAEAWARRLREGLSIEEEIALADWLAASTCHEASLRKYQNAWDKFAPLARASAAGLTLPVVAGHGGGHGDATQRDGNSSRGYSKLRRWVAPLVGLAAAFAVLLTFLPRSGGPPLPDALTLPGPCEQLTLSDGSVVELNRGAEVAVMFTDHLRRVRLVRGEALFSVAKDAARPFVVAVDAVEVRAVGTAFNVRFDRAAVEVIVSEGKVQIEDAPARGTIVTAGQAAFVTLDSASVAPHVSTLSPAEIAARLAWQPKMLDFDNAPLSEIVGEFNRRNPVRLVVRDPVVASRRMTATFRSDNLEAFVRLIEANIGVRAERIDETQIALVRR